MTTEVTVQTATDPIETLPLNRDEKQAYKDHMKAGKPPVSPTINAQLFNLFLAGHTCQEIVKINPNLGLGMVVRARIEGMWDERRRVLTAELLDGVKEVAFRAQADSIKFVGDLLTAAHRHIGEKVQRYIQTGDEEHIKDVGIHSLKQYKEIVELLLKLTGQDGKREVKLKGEGAGGTLTGAPVVTVEAKDVTPGAGAPPGFFPGPLTKKEASRALAILEAELIEPEAEEKDDGE